MEKLALKTWASDMSPLFLYGTLRHLPLLEAVLGRSLAAGDVVDGSLRDHAVLQVEGEDFPALVKQSGALARGLVLRTPTPEDRARLDYFEGGFCYDLKPVSIGLDDGATCSAQAFFPQPGQWRTAGHWSLEDWVATWGRISVRVATEAMDWYGRLSAQELASRLGAIRSRAGAWVAARDRPVDPGREMSRDVVVEAHCRPYMRYLAVEEMDLRYRRYDGTMSPVLNRGALLVGHAAVVLPYDPVSDRVLLIEQFRAPLYIGGDPAPWIWEPVAGMVDPGETPEDAARREAQEEAGLCLSRLEPAGQVYPSTGCSAEFQYLFVAIADLSGTGTTGGLDSEGEDIRVRTFSYEALMQGIDRAEVRNLQLVTLALWLARNRDRLRAGR